MTDISSINIFDNLKVKKIIIKNLFTLVAFILTTTLLAQAPQGFSYQATVKNNVGGLIIH